eukprot:COSAG06_NODE_1604_length_8955_cov_51.674840_4_plen_854_part_00
MRARFAPTSQVSRPLIPTTGSTAAIMPAEPPLAQGKGRAEWRRARQPRTRPTRRSALHYALSRRVGRSSGTGGRALAMTVVLLAAAGPLVCGAFDLGPPPPPPPPPANLKCSAANGALCVNGTEDSGCGSTDNLCTCQVGREGSGFVCGRTCNGRTVNGPQCSPDMAQLIGGCPACCSSALFNTTGCAVCYEQQCTFDCNTQGAICSAQCAENCVMKSMIDVRLFSPSFWRAPFRNGTCMADCWKGDWVASVLSEFKTVSTTIGVVLPYMFRFFADFAGEMVLDQFKRLFISLCSLCSLCKVFCCKRADEASSADERQPLLSGGALERGVSVEGPAPSTMSHEAEVHSDDSRKCMKPCSEIPGCSTPNAYARWSKMRLVTGCLALVLTITNFALYYWPAYYRFASHSNLDQVVLLFFWVAHLVIRIAMWTPAREDLVYAPGSKDITVKAAPGFTMYDLQGHESTWAEAVKGRGFANGQAIWHAFKRMLFWHLAQPVMYAVVLLVYWSSLLFWQKGFAIVVAFREFTYILLLMLACWKVPAFLLVDISKSMASMHDTLHPINGWLFLVVYVFAPEKFVGMALMQRQEEGHDGNSCWSGNSLYFQPRNRSYWKKYDRENAGRLPQTMTERKESYLPGWVRAPVATVFFGLIVVLDLIGWSALMLPYTGLKPFAAECVQFKNTVAGGPNEPPAKYPAKQTLAHTVMLNPCDLVIDGGEMSSSQCATNSQAMLDDSSGAIFCRYTEWPDALFFCYVVTILSGGVLLMFSVYRFAFPPPNQTIIQAAGTYRRGVVAAGSGAAELRLVGRGAVAAATPSSTKRSKKQRKKKDKAGVQRDSFAVSVGEDGAAVGKQSGSE